MRKDAISHQHGWLLVEVTNRSLLVVRLRRVAQVQWGSHVFR